MQRLGEQNILILTRNMGLGGTENVVLQLCEILRSQVNKIIVCSSGGIHEEELKRMGIKHYIIPDISSKSPFDMIRIFLKIRNIIKIEDVTIIHSHHRMASFYAEIIANKKIVKIANAHNTFEDKKRLTLFAYKNTKIIAVGEMVKRNLVEFYGIPSQQISVIHNAIKPFDGNYEEIDIFTYERSKGNVLIGNVGRLSEQKGMKYFIDAAELILKENKNVRFYIIGDGELKDELIDKVRKKHLENFISFLGYRSDIQNVMSQLDFIVLSSLWEGLPLTPIEAFSVGKTVIGTAVDGTPEIIKDGKNGVLVNAKDSLQLSLKMKELINDEILRKKLGENAKKSYEESFSFKKLSKEYIEYYERL